MKARHLKNSPGRGRIRPGLTATHQRVGSSRGAMSLSDNVQSRATARFRLDNLIRSVWLAFAEEYRRCPDAFTDEDAELWELITRHQAIQQRLDEKLGR